MVNLRRELVVLWLCAVGAWLGLSACGPAPTPVSTLSLTLSASAVELAPGETTVVQVQVSTHVSVSPPIHLTVIGENTATLPAGLSVAFEPTGLTVLENGLGMAELRMTAVPTAMAGTYSLIVTAQSDHYEATDRLQVTLSGDGQGWLRHIGTTGSEALTALAVDSTGSLYAGGQTTGAFSGLANVGQFDGFLLKYQPSGALQWSQTLATIASDIVTAVAIDAADNIYVAGYTYGAFPGHLATGKADGFVAKYSPSGTRLWLSQIGTAEMDQFTALAVDPTGGVVVLGATEGGFGLTTNKGPIGTSDVVVVKLAADGKQVFTQQLGTDHNERPGGVAVDTTGAIYAVGSTQGVFPGASSAGNYDLLVFKLLADGAPSWLRQSGSSEEEHLTAALIDGKGSLVAAGWARGQLPNHLEIVAQDALLVGYSPAGELQLTKKFGTIHDDVLSGMTRVGDILYTIGSTRGIFHEQIPWGAADIFVVRHTPDGGNVWLSQTGTGHADAGNAIAATTNAIYLGGTTFGAFPGQLRQGDSDGFVFQLRVGGATY